MAVQKLGLKLPIRLGQDGYFDTNTTTSGQIADNINNILLTKPGERRFNNEFGSSLYSLLFEANTLELNQDLIIDSVQRDIDRFLNGVIVTNVKVSLNQTQPENTDYNKVHLSINFTYNQIQSTTNVEITNNNL